MVSTVEQYLNERDAALEELKHHLARAQQKMKVWVNGKRQDVVFNVGDPVYLKLHPCYKKSLVKRYKEELATRYFGPFENLERIGKVTYKLVLPPTANIHPIFHVSQLRRLIGDLPTTPTILKTLTDELVLTMKPEALLGILYDSNESHGAMEALIK